LSCNNLIYLKNLIESLEEAKKQENIERIILYASELERYKIVCGNSLVIQQFEASIRRVSEELGLTNYSTIERALDAHPEHLCQCHTCEQSPPTQHQEGFRGMLDAAAGISERNIEEEEHSNIERSYGMGFGAMLEAAAHGTIERSFQDVEPNPPIRSDGFLGQLEDAYRGRK
jgi:hypothetical protein